MHLRIGLWRSWLVATAVWTIGVLWLRWPYLVDDCGYFVEHGDQNAWAMCRYTPDAMSFPAAAWLLLPPPLVLLIGFWLARGFQPDFGRINKRVVIGVFLLPLWILDLIGNLNSWSEGHFTNGSERSVNLLVGALVIQFMFLGAFALLVFLPPWKPWKTAPPPFPPQS
jgi:hypothetical protein